MSFKKPTEYWDVNWLLLFFLIKSFNLFPSQIFHVFKIPETNFKGSKDTKINSVEGKIFTNIW